MTPELNIDANVVMVNEILNQIAPGLRASIAVVVLGPAAAHFFKMDITDPGGETRKFGVIVANEMTAEVLAGTIQGLVRAAQIGQAQNPAPRIIKPS